MMPYVTSFLDRLNARTPYRAIVQLEGRASSSPVYREATILGPAREIFYHSIGSRSPLSMKLVLVHIDGESEPRQISVERILRESGSRRPSR